MRSGISQVGLAQHHQRVAQQVARATRLESTCQQAASECRPRLAVTLKSLRCFLLQNFEQGGNAGEQGWMRKHPIAQGCQEQECKAKDVQDVQDVPWSCSSASCSRSIDARSKHISAAASAHEDELLHMQMSQLLSVQADLRCLKAAAGMEGCATGPTAHLNVQKNAVHERWGDLCFNLSPRRGVGGVVLP